MAEVLRMSDRKRRFIRCQTAEWLPLEVRSVEQCRGLACSIFRLPKRRRSMAAGAPAERLDIEPLGVSRLGQAVESATGCQFFPSLGAEIEKPYATVVL